MLVYGKCDCSVMQIFVSCVHPVEVLNAAFCMTCSLLILVEDVRGDHMEEEYSRASLITSPFPSVMDIFFVDPKFRHIRFYTL